jgi:hypothetical protein
MTKLPEGIDFKGIYCYQNKNEPSTFFYLPREPKPEPDPQGKPTLTLWVSEQGAMLQCAAQWGADAELLVELRDYLAQKFQLDPVLIRLSPAPVSVKGVTLSMGDGAGKFRALKTASSSGYSPYTTVFNVQLTAEEKTQAVAALNGRQRFLSIGYQMALAVEILAETAIAGDVREDIAVLGKEATLEACLAQIETAIAAGRLSLTHSGTAEPSDAIWQKAERLVKEKAATILQRFVQGAIANPAQSTIEASVSLADTAMLPIERSTDVSSWFPKGKGTDHIRVLPASIPGSDQPPPPPVTTGRTVRLGFDAKEIGIAFIQLTQGDAKQTLRAPDFNSITLPANQSANPLLVKTHYTDSGPPFEVTLATPSAEGWVLSPKDLGLVKVAIDGSALREAGCKQARVRVLYRPSGKGSEDDRTIYLRRDDWTASWYIVTRSSNLNGVLEYEWKETKADGSVVKHPFVTTDKPELKL